MTGTSPSLAYFRDLGDRVEQKTRDGDEEAFADIVDRELERTPPGDAVDVDELLDGLLDPLHTGSPQLAPTGVFGQPGVTLYHGREFVIDVYFWNNAVPAIHNHPFSGVFTLLRGHSIHSEYRFENVESLGPRAAAGTLRPAGLSLIREGDRVPFSKSGHALIHSLVHVPNPTGSMVVRTIRTLEYFRYFPPSFSLAMSEPDDHVVRQLALLEMLRRAEHKDYGSHLRRFLGAADFETTFRTISAAYGPYREAGRVHELIDLARERHGERVDLIPPAIETAYREQQDNALRERFLDDDGRFVASVLMCAPDRASAFRLLGEQFGDGDLIGLLEKWAAAAGLVDKTDADRTAALNRLLTSPAPEDQALWADTILRSLAVVAGA